MRRCALAVLSFAAASILCAQPQPDFSGSFVLSIEGEPIRYNDPPKDDPIARLQARLDRGETKLQWDARHGYLPSVLKELGIPASSQTLVFSKTSFQLQRIAPETPRAIYFNDDVYAGWVQNGDVVELSAADPTRGGMFYVLVQKKSEAPRFERRDECLQCHASPKTLGVPGHLVRSVYPDAQGFPLTNIGSFVSDHRSPFQQRFGGWYVTGSHGGIRHMGNAIVADTNQPEKLDLNQGANRATLPVDGTPYLGGAHSDLVALMVLEHQTAMHNYVTRAGFDVRIGLEMERAMNRALKQPEDVIGESARRRMNNAAEILVRFLLFADEEPLASPIRGSSAFAAEFAKAGPRDAKGRSLRDFDLQRRLFRYPCSFLIYSPAFDALPSPLLARVYQRLDEVLSAAEPPPAYKKLPVEVRAATREILLATKPAFAAAVRGR